MARRTLHLLVTSLLLVAITSCQFADESHVTSPSGVTAQSASLPSTFSAKDLANPWPGETDVTFNAGPGFHDVTLSRNALNDLGQVAGFGIDFFNEDFSHHRVIFWDVDHTEVGDERILYPIGFALNDAGDILGQRGAPMGAFILGRDRSLRYLIAEPRGSAITPLDINNLGQAVILNSVGEALLWDGDQVTNLGAGIPWAINDRGRIVGESAGRAVMWKDGLKLDLFEGAAYAINSSNQVVGTSNGRAVMWSYGTLTDLGPGQAHGINDRLRIVGRSGGRAVLWYEGSIVDLGPGIATAINNNHQVLVGKSILTNPWW